MLKNLKNKSARYTKDKSLAKFSFVRNLFLDSEEHGRVPLIEPWNCVVIFHLGGVGLNILVLQVLAQCLHEAKNRVSCQPITQSLYQKSNLLMTSLKFYPNLTLHYIRHK